MRFLVDAQLPPALAHWIADHDHEGEHVADLGMQTAPDRLIWEHASTHGKVIVTKDEDFARRRALAADGPQIVWLRIGNTRRGVLLSLFATVFQQVVRALERGELLVEVRST